MCYTGTQYVHLMTSNSITGWKSNPGDIPQCNFYFCNVLIDLGLKMTQKMIWHPYRWPVNYFFYLLNKYIHIEFNKKRQDKATKPHKNKRTLNITTGGFVISFHHSPKVMSLIQNQWFVSLSVIILNPKAIVDTCVFLRLHQRQMKQIPVQHFTLSTSTLSRE